jgi:hypothetical protein
MPLGDLVDKAKETAKSAKDTTGTWIVSGKEKLQAGVMSAAEETYKLIDILKSSGFNIGNMTITISELSKLQLGTINALLAAYNLTDITTEHGYAFGYFDLTLSIPPQVTVHLVTSK